MTASSAKKASAANVQEGAKAPEFLMPVEEGREVSLASLAGKKVVLYFYPKDDTPGCTVEAKDFAAMMPEFEKAGAVIIGVSKDSLKSHDKFRDKYCLPFMLGADEESGVCEAYGVWTEKNMYGKNYMGIERSTFLIDGDGTIARIWRKVKVEGHAKEVLDAVKAL